MGDGSSRNDSWETLADSFSGSAFGDDSDGDTLVSSETDSKAGTTRPGLTATEILITSFYETPTIRRIEIYAAKRSKGRQAETRIFLITDSLLHSDTRLFLTYSLPELCEPEPDICNRTFT